VSGHILIVDDRKAVRNGLRSLLSYRPEWNICVEAADGLEAVQKPRNLICVSGPEQGKRKNKGSDFTQPGRWITPPRSRYAYSVDPIVRRLGSGQR
jgi:hypothetical protein